MPHEPRRDTDLFGNPLGGDTNPLGPGEGQPGHNEDLGLSLTAEEWLMFEEALAKSAEATENTPPAPGEMSPTDGKRNRIIRITTPRTIIIAGVPPKLEEPDEEADPQDTERPAS
jgi:hypothetical protein